MDHFPFQSLNLSLGVFIVLCLSALIMTGCAFVSTSMKDQPNLEQKPVLTDFDPYETPLGKIHQKAAKNHPNKDAAFLLSDGTAALLHRTALARMATKSILMQTYIYKNDPESKLLMFELLQAANRGVDVKILIDDNGLDSDFSDIITLDSHPNIEVKIFNPYRNRYRILRYAEMIYDFKRITHRMHNKIFVVDNLALIVGGRNLADNYFDNNKDVNFTDTDAIFIGKVALEAVENFKLYWDFHASVNASLLPNKYTMKNYLQNLQRTIAKLEKEQSKWQKYDEIMQEFTKAYKEQHYTASWGEAKFLGDEPTKIEQNASKLLITEALKELTYKTNDSLYIASAYFVPGDAGTTMLEGLRAKNVKIYTLTNSLSSVDSAVVYAAWQRYRDKLLELGIEVYEYAYSGSKKKSGVRGKLSSGSSLHSKIMVFDEELTWVGSFNLDNRSHELNTESVVVFKSKEFADIAKQSIQEDIENSWQLIRKEGKTLWQRKGEQGELEIHKKPPDTSIFLRIFNFLSKALPEEQI